MQFFIEDRQVLAPGDLARGVGQSRIEGGNVLGRPAFEIGPQLPGDAVGDAVEPAGQRVALADAPRLASEDQERCLAGVLGVVLAAQCPPANAQHERPVALDDGGKGRLVLLCSKVRQQLLVGQVADLPRRRQAADTAQDKIELAVAHGRFPPRRPETSGPALN